VPNSSPVFFYPDIMDLKEFKYYFYNNIFIFNILYITNKKVIKIIFLII